MPHWSRHSESGIFLGFNGYRTSSSRGEDIGSVSFFSHFPVCRLLQVYVSLRGLSEQERWAEPTLPLSPIPVIPLLPPRPGVSARVAQFPFALLLVRILFSREDSRNH